MAEAESCKRELTIEVPAEEVRREVERVTQMFQRRARVPGFRPGKTPLHIVRQRFNEDIRHDVLHELVPRYIEQRMKQEGLSPVSSPDIADVELNLESAEPMRFKASFEVLPEFELRDYSGIDVELEESEVSDEEVEAELKQMQEREATYEPVEDRPLQDGDFGSISMKGREAGSTRPAVKVDQLYCEIGGEGTLPEFSENLRGAAPGDERDFKVTYPQDYGDRRVAGKTLEYSVRVDSVKRKQVPELNDDFARDLGEFTTLDEVRASIRGRLLEEKRQRAERKAKDRLLDRLTEMHNFTVPNALIERQLRSRMERTVRQLLAQGVDPAKLDVDWTRVQTSQREGSQRDVQASLILERIADQEKIEVTEEDFQREVDELSEQSQRRADAASMRARLTSPEVADKIKNRLRNEKTLDFVYRQANKIAARPSADS